MKRMMALSLVGCMMLTACSSGSTADTTEEDSGSSSFGAIVTTGQTLTYDADGNVITVSEGDAFYGQDGNYESLAFSYTLNDNGTTYDNNTGLTWVTNPDGGKMTWDDAVAYVESLNTMENEDGTIGFAGYTDWRLPSTEELFSISDFSVGWPYIDTDYFGFDESASEAVGDMGAMSGSPQGGSPQGGDTAMMGEMMEGEMAEMSDRGGMTEMSDRGEMMEGEMPEMSDRGEMMEGDMAEMSDRGGMTEGEAPMMGGNSAMMGEMPEGDAPMMDGEAPMMDGDAPMMGELPEGDMSMDMMASEGAVSKEEGQYWTNEYNQVEGDDRLGDIAFGVNHATGHIKAYPSNAEGMGKYVRAVRGDEYGVEDYTNNGDGTITDNTSGLMWLEVDLGVAVDWEEALALAESSEFAGYDDWRLPDVKELQSIVSYDGSYPAINQDYFVMTALEENENYYFWTSTSAYFSEMEPDYNSAWYVAFGYTSHGAGAVRFSPKYEGSDALSEGEDNILNSVRLVRYVD